MGRETSSRERNSVKTEGMLPRNREYHVVPTCMRSEWQMEPHLMWKMWLGSDKKLGGDLGTGLVVLYKCTCSDEIKSFIYVFAKRLSITLVSVYGITLCSN